MQICFATHNQNKAAEIRALLPEGLELITLKEIGQNEEIPETGKTLEENSEIKARFVFEKFNIPCFSDDTGLEVSALNGEPGVYSARYAGDQKDNEANINLLLSNLERKSDRSAAFKTVITYLDQEGNRSQFVGEAHGEIIHDRTGEEGFGYDPIFKPSGFEITFAQMTKEEKNAISHRGRAFKKFIGHLNRFKKE
ncbi:MAG: RdgB/HAM1 family non-canonical purine NTP pyrophosphatase [Cyclobacteriaceae bacterium]